jgi:DNA polymerase-3 subunit alpha
MERLQHELEAVGFYLSGHPIEAYASVLSKLGVISFAELAARAERGLAGGRMAGIVVVARERRSQRGNKFAFVRFSDPTGPFEALLFAETLSAARALLEPGTPVIVTVEAELEGEGVKLRALAVDSLEAAAKDVERGMKLVLDRGMVEARRLPWSDLKALLRPGGKGRVSLAVVLEDRGREVEFAVPGRFEISPSEKGALAAVPGVLEVLET